MSKIIKCSDLKLKIYIEDTCLEPKNRIEMLSLMNFASPYIELPKKLTVRQNLLVYGKLYNVRNLNEQIDYLSNKLRLNKLLKNCLLYTSPSPRD